MPIGLLDVAGYWQPLLAMLDHMVAERLLRAEHRNTLLVSTDASVLLDQLAGYEHRATDKWLDRRGSEA
jgi:hypothetical protein